MSGNLQPHLLFNFISQGKPLFIADLRGQSAFQKCHLRNSNAIDIFVKDSWQSLSLVIDKNSVILVCVIDEHSVHEAGRVLELVRRDSEFNKILSIEYLDFDNFYNKYPQCAYLYIGSDFPQQNMKLPAKEYPTDIIPQFLYLGSYYDAKDECIMSHLRITHIIDATGEKLSQSNSNKLGLSYLPIHIWDMEGVDIAQHFELVFSFIEQARSHPYGKILIHCRAGISRSATFVLAYLMQSGRVDCLKSALQMVVSQRPYVLPNPSFRDQLRAYEQSLLGKSSFADDVEMMELISSMNHCWSGLFTRETDFDRIPIAFVKKSANALTHIDEFPTEEQQTVVGDQKPKKPFLKKGTGKNPPASKFSVDNDAK
eukprot:gene17460-24154_t